MNRWKPSGSSSPRSPLSSLSPLSSPKLAGLPGKLRNRIPTQLRRVLPIYLICVTLFVLVLQVLPSPKQQPPSIQKRHTLQKPLDGTEPPNQPPGFPKKIWQTWKVDPLNFEPRDHDTAQTWTSKNPSHRYEVLTDHNDLAYIQAKFGPAGLNRPDLVDLYASINATIIKADLLRYLVMYADGGVYADIDVEALRPINRFIPARYDPADIDMVIGVEIDQPEFADHPILGQKSMSFCQWTFMCRPRLPVMLRLIENIQSWLGDLARKQKVAISELTLDFDEVISGTGPSAFTAAILDAMNRPFPSQTRKEKVTWDNFHGLDESLLISRVLVLNVESFAAGQGHSDSGNHGSRAALVKHHYHASNWPSRHPRFKHPAYGEVERCNWDKECVRKWDEDVKRWEGLGEEERRRLVGKQEGRETKEGEGVRRRERQVEAVKRLAEVVRERAEEGATGSEMVEGGSIREGREKGQEPRQGQAEPGFGFPHAIPPPPPPLPPPPPPGPFLGPSEAGGGRLPQG